MVIVAGCCVSAHPSSRAAGAITRVVANFEAGLRRLSFAERSTNIVSDGSLAMVGGYQRSERTSVGGRV
jgi:hypothetical protein